MGSEAILRGYVSHVERDLRSGTATEHTYRPYLKAMLEALVPGITATNEPKRRVDCGAPDYVITRIVGSQPLTIGYIEAKDVGVALSATETSEQLQRYRRSLPNLVLTDYLEFRWYVNGEHRMTARLASVGAGHKLVWDVPGAERVVELLQGFLTRSPEPIKSPKELAERLARMAHIVRDLTLEAFEAERSGDADTRRELEAPLRTLHGLQKAFRDVLLPDLSETDFADMFAQTLAYGLFAARYNHTGSAPFRRQDAAREIPRTNPFLKKLFESMTGTDLDDAPFVGFVDDLAQLLAYSDLAAVLAEFGKRTRTDDPIVHFYETFLAAYDPKLREVRGVYYTPEPVVSYIVRSVDHLLKTEFGCAEGLADTSEVVRTVQDGEVTRQERWPRVLVLDPATGTGTFLYTVINLIRDRFRASGSAGMWPGYVHAHLLPRLFGFELLMAPYTMAHLKLGMQLAGLDLPETERTTWAYDFNRYNERLGVFLTNTLEEAAKRTSVMFAEYISDEANAAASVKQGKPVMVVLGNPPYSGHSANKGDWITKLLRGTDILTGKATENYFEVDGRKLGERNPKWLNDDYVKFMRFAQWRIEQTGYGILAFITNHGYLDNPTFRGMRQSLMRTFDDVYVLNLRGNSNKREQPSSGGKDENVFDIQQGVAIGIFVRRQRTAELSAGATGGLATVRHADLWGEREAKYGWLTEHYVGDTAWTVLSPKAPFYFFVPQDTRLEAEFRASWSVAEAMPVNNIGMNSHRDAFAVAFDSATLQQRVADLASSRLTDDDLRAKYGLEDTSDFSLSKARQSVRRAQGKNSLIVPCVYRPFDFRYVLYDMEVLDRPRPELNQHIVGHENLELVTTRQTREPFASLVVDKVCGQHKIVAAYDGSSIFPLYLYPDPAKPVLFQTEPPSTAPGERRANLSPAFVSKVASSVEMTWVPDGKGDLAHTIGPEDVLAYVYAVLNAPSYRDRYADFLKTEFPRVPLTSNADLFRELSRLGDGLIDLHLLRKHLPAITRFPIVGSSLVESVKYTEPTESGTPGRVWINGTQYFEGVPPEVWEFLIGGYQVCEKWLKDRKGRTLSYDDLAHYQQMVAALAETRRVMDQIDEAIEEHGGWPLEARHEQTPSGS